MREEEAGARYLSPLVKQDLANLDADGESRRIALKSLKHFVEQLDPSTMPRFLTQIAESRESGGSRSYAISVYEEVARIHGKLIIPHIPRVMASLIRSLSSSGSSPQLQQACAKVTASLSRHTIDSTLSLEEAEDIIRDICDPLVEALAGKLEPVSAGAAACLHALVETEKWKYACDETVHDVCQRTAIALGEKVARTVFHMQLVCALASANPDALSIYGTSLLRTGEDILKLTGDSWQHRKAAAKLLQAVLTILDKETLQIELDTTYHALDSCRLDKMPHVRAAVSEALHTAKMLSSGDSIRISVSMTSTPTSRGRSGPITPNSRRAASPTSQESNHMSFSPPSASTSESMHLRHNPSPARSTGRRVKRAPLYPARGMGFTQSPRCSVLGTSPSSSTTEGSESSLHKLDAKENVPSHSTGVNGVLSQQEVLGLVQGHIKYVRPRAPVTSTVYTPVLCSQLDRYGMEHPMTDEETKPLKDKGTEVPTSKATRDASAVSNNEAASRLMTPLVSEILYELTETATSIIAEDYAGLAHLDSKYEEAYRMRPSFGNGVEVILPRLRLGSFSNTDAIPHSEYNSIGGRASSINSQDGLMSKQSVDSRSEPANMSRNGLLNVERSTVTTMNNSEGLVSGIQGNDEKSLGFVTPSHGEVNTHTHHYNSLAHLNISPKQENSKSLITAKDFLPFSTPKRVMRTLLSTSESRGSLLEQDMKLSQDNVVSCGLTPQNSDLVDMDLETSSEAGWSVRDNPIASDESFQAESSDDEELEERRSGLHESFVNPLKEVTTTDDVSPRKIHMVSLNHRKSQQDVDQAAALDFSSLSKGHSSRATPSSSSGGSDIYCQTCSTCAYNNSQQTPPWCRSRAPKRAVKELKFEAGKPLSSGLSSLLHEDEVKKYGLCCSCSAAVEGSVIGNFAEEEEVDSLIDTSSVKKEQQNGWHHCGGLSQYSPIQLVTRNWKKVCWYAEVVLGSSLCVVIAIPLAMVIAIPLAMVIARALNDPRDYQLVPT